MKNWVVWVGCKACKIDFFGRIVIQQMDAPSIGSEVSSMTCPKCKKKVIVTKLFNKV